MGLAGLAAAQSEARAKAEEECQHGVNNVTYVAHVIQIYDHKDDEGKNRSIAQRNETASLALGGSLSGSRLDP